MVAYTYVPPSMIPGLLPWMAILVLLLLRPNRKGSAWWIWVALGCGWGLEAGLAAVAGERYLPTEILNGPGKALVFSVAALWLLSSYLAWKHRFLTFLAAAFIMALMGSFVYAVTLETDGFEALGLGIMLCVVALVTAVALSLAGLASRRKYAPARLFGWMLVWCVAIPLAVALPFFVIARVTSGPTQLLDFFGPVLAIAGTCFAAVLPYLVLSFANSLYRERLQGLLHLEDGGAPPVIHDAPVGTVATGA